MIFHEQEEMQTIVKSVRTTIYTLQKMRLNREQFKHTSPDPIVDEMLAQADDAYLASLEKIDMYLSRKVDN